MKTTLKNFGIMLLGLYLISSVARPLVTRSVLTVTANTTLTSSNDVVICTQTAAITLTLPAASSNSGVVFQIANHGVGNVTLSVPVTVARNETMTAIGPNLGGNLFTIISDGTTYRLISQ